MNNFMKTIRNRNEISDILNKCITHCHVIFLNVTYILIYSKNKLHMSLPLSH